MAPWAVVFFVLHAVKSRTVLIDDVSLLLVVLGGNMLHTRKQGQFLDRHVLLRWEERPRFRYTTRIHAVSVPYADDLELVMLLR